MMQLSLLDYINRPSLPSSGSAAFDGETTACDRQRLNIQLIAVKQLMRDGEWRTLKEIAANVHAPEASCSARLRDLRKSNHGGHTVERRHVKNGLFEYKLILSQ